jgi:hypothetical protein
MRPSPALPLASKLTLPPPAHLLPTSCPPPQDTLLAAKYRSEALAYYEKSGQDMRYSWDNVYMGVTTLLAKMSPGSPSYSTRLEYSFNSWMSGWNGITITPKVCNT